MVAEHRADVLADFGALGLAAVEADRDAVTGEETGEGLGVVPVPGLEQSSIELADGSLRCIGHFPAYATLRGGPIVAASGPKDST